MKSDVSRDINALFYIRRMSFKNRVRQILDSPLKTIMSVLKWVFYFALIFSPLLIHLISGKGKSPFPTQDLTIIEPYVGGGILLLLLLYVFYTLKKAVDDYKPTIFKAADANLVFSSPINRHTIYLYALLRAMFKNLMSAVTFVCVFLMVTLSMRIRFVTWAIPLAVLGLFSFGVFMQSFRFFINSLNKKLKSDKFTTFIFYMFLAAVVIIVLHNIALTNHTVPAIFSVLSSASFEYIPFAGWTKGLVTGLIYANPRMTLFTVLYLCCAVASLVLSVFWADDYYEDTILCLGEAGEIMEAAKKGRTEEIIAHGYRGKKQANTSVSFRGKGASAFLWKSLLLYKKNLITRPVSNLVGYLFFLIIGILFAVFSKQGDSSQLIILLLIFTFSVSSIGVSATSPVISELKHAYIFMAPGKLRYKLFYTVIQPIIKFAVEFLLAIIPMLILGKAGPIDLACAYLASVTMGALPVSGGVIVTAIFPDDEALRKNPFMAMLRGFFIMIYYLPGGIICALCLLLSWLMAHTLTFPVGLLGLAAGNVLTVILMFFISEKIFSRIEYKQ